MEQIAEPETLWSAAVEEADWIAAGLAPAEQGLVASVVPQGFPAYARLLHPAHYVMAKGARTVRWREIAEWSGVPLHPDSQFHSIALPPQPPSRPAPWNSQGPERGSLDAADAEALVELLAGYTTTPSACLFCLWDGWGWDTAMYAALPGETQIPLQDPVPPEVRYGPRVRLPGRDYLLYTGPIDAALAFTGPTGQTPNLWWPADRAWCVASEVGLCWTYVGGSVPLIEELLADPALEALPTIPGHPHSWTEEHVLWSARQAAADLLASGKASVETAGGAVRATLRHAGGMGRRVGGRTGSLRIQSEGHSGVSSRDEYRLAGAGPDELTAEIAGYLTAAITGLVEN
jgi:hypothetical protein